MPYAFQNTQISGDIVLPKSLETISANAFSKCLSLKSVTISNPTCEIGDTAFEGANENLVIYGLTGSTAEKFAILHKFKFVSIGEYKVPDESVSTETGDKPDNKDQSQKPAKNNLVVVIIIAAAVVLLIIIIIVFIVIAAAIKNKNYVLPELIETSENTEDNTDNFDADLE